MRHGVLRFACMFAKMFYVLVKTLCRWVLVVLFRARAYYAERVPREGALILAANHQSYIDPPLVGAFIQRAASYIARAGLFKFKPFGACLKAINCVPLQENTGDAGAIREAIRRLEGGHAVLIFPEGSRSMDGAMHEYKRGVALLVKRAKCPVVPVAVEGCWDAWPRGGKPRWFVPVAVMYGHAIAYDELMKDGADAALQRLARETQAMRIELRAKLRERTAGKYPVAGAGDSAEIVGEG